MRSGQASLFGMIEEPHPSLKPSLRPLPAPSTMEQLGWEKETLGIFVSGHPLADVKEALARTGAITVRELRGVEDDAPVKVAGLVTTVRRTLTKAQSQMLIATIEDTTGAIECRRLSETVRASCRRVSSRTRSSSSRAACGNANAAARSRATKRRSN